MKTNKRRPEWISQLFIYKSITQSLSPKIRLKFMLKKNWKEKLANSWSTDKSVYLERSRKPLKLNEKIIQIEVIRIIVKTTNKI